METNQASAQTHRGADKQLYSNTGEVSNRSIRLGHPTTDMAWLSMCVCPGHSLLPPCLCPTAHPPSPRPAWGVGRGPRCLPPSQWLMLMSLPASSAECLCTLLGLLSGDAIRSLHTLNGRGTWEEHRPGTHAPEPSTTQSSTTAKEPHGRCSSAATVQRPQAVFANLSGPQHFPAGRACTVFRPSDWFEPR